MTQNSVWWSLPLNSSDTEEKKVIDTCGQLVATESKSNSSASTPLPQPQPQPPTSRPSSSLSPPFNGHDIHYNSPMFNVRESFLKTLGLKVVHIIKTLSTSKASFVHHSTGPPSLWWLLRSCWKSVNAQNVLMWVAQMVVTGTPYLIEIITPMCMQGPPLGPFPLCPLMPLQLPAIIYFHLYQWSSYNTPIVSIYCYWCTDYMTIYMTIYITSP